MDTCRDLQSAEAVELPVAERQHKEERGSTKRGVRDVTGASGLDRSRCHRPLLSSRFGHLFGVCVQ